MKIITFIRNVTWAVCLTFALQSHAAQSGNDSLDPPQPDLIRIKGSDTLSKVLIAWSNTYQAITPNLRMEVASGGSGNGIAALINGHVEIAATSRPLRKREIYLITRKYGDAIPVNQVVALDAISIMVHKNNPLNGISFNQLKEIYSKSGAFKQWSDLGIQVPGCQDQKIIPLNRKNNSGTYTFFRNAIFKKHEHFDPKLITLGTSNAIIDMVAQMPCTIGYSGMAFITGQVKTLCISKDQAATTPCVPPTAASTLDHTYPLARALYLYTLGPPTGVVKQFLTWITQPEGQEILLRTGYVQPP